MKRELGDEKYVLLTFLVLIGVLLSILVLMKEGKEAALEENMVC